MIFFKFCGLEFRLNNEESMSCIDSWKRVLHANIVTLRGAFTTRAFSDNSLLFCYDYHPLSKTLNEKYLFKKSNNSNWIGISESLMWSFIIQIASALKYIHSLSLAARVIDPTKILITGKNRIRISCCGIIDMLTWESDMNTARQNLVQFQQEDLASFGQLIIALGTGSLLSLHNMSKSIDALSKQYSSELKDLVLYLLGNSIKTVDDVLSMIGPRILHEINSAHLYNLFLHFYKFIDTMICLSKSCLKS